MLNIKLNIQKVKEGSNHPPPTSRHRPAASHQLQPPVNSRLHTLKVWIFCILISCINNVPSLCLCVWRELWETLERKRGCVLWVLCYCKFRIYWNKTVFYPLWVFQSHHQWLLPPTIGIRAPFVGKQKSFRVYPNFQSCQIGRASCRERV